MIGTQKPYREIFSDALAKEGINGAERTKLISFFVQNPSIINFSINSSLFNRAVKCFGKPNQSSDPPEYE